MISFLFPNLLGLKTSITIIIKILDYFQLSKCASNHHLFFPRILQARKSLCLACSGNLRLQKLTSASLPQAINQQYFQTDMHLRTQTAFAKYYFAIINKQDTFKTMNGTIFNKNQSIRTLDRSIAHQYFNAKFKIAQHALQKRLPLARSVQAFQTAIFQDPLLRMYFQGALDSIPPKGMLSRASAEEVFYLLSITTTSAPRFQGQEVTGIPYYLLFLDFFDTRYGKTFFSNPIVNQHLKQIFDDYLSMLCSTVSLQYLNEQEPYGWFCPTAQKFINYDEHYVDKTKPHWGFQNWNQWFIRKIRPEARPIDPRPNAIVNGSDSYPLSYNQGQQGNNPTYNVKGYDKFWLKDNTYSLYDMLGADRMGINSLVDKYFVGGTVYQAFLDPFCYHRWHSPVSGTIVKSYKLEGSYFLEFPGEISTQAGYFMDSQPIYSMLAVRQVFIIRLDDGSDRHIAVVEIGMAEISSCQPTVIQGQTVKKGDQLGYFQFGGSSDAIIFDKRFNLTFNPSIKAKNANGDSIMQKVNSWLATFQ